MRRPSASMIVALVALFVALSGVGVAANGGSLILGHANSASLNTSLSAPVAGGKALQVTNNNTSSASSTALGLNVAAGHAPFTVNSAVKVANLNASYLGGIGPSGFMQGTGGMAQSGLITIDFGGAVVLGSVPNVGVLWGNCENASASSANVVLQTNSTLGQLLYVDFRSQNAVGGSGHVTIPIVGNTTQGSAIGLFSSGSHTASIYAAVLIPFPGNAGCEFMAQATSSG